MSRREEDEARAHAERADAGHQHHMAGSAGLTWRERVGSVDAWSDVAHNFRGDWEMLWKEIGAGFLIAGFVSLLPKGFFNALFLTDAPAWVRVPENAIVGPLVAALSFVCSVGNIPLAAVLWAGGISFAGVIAFVFADLLIIPIALIYRKVYGGRIARQARRADARRDGRRGAARRRDLLRRRARPRHAAEAGGHHRAADRLELHARC